MRHRFIVFVVAVLLIASSSLVAQVSPVFLQTARGLVGERTDVSLLAKANLASADSISFSGNVRLTGKLFLTNPTVFYPEKWFAAQGIQLTKDSLARDNDSVYAFDISLRCTQSVRCDTLVRLRGEILAASDSVTDIRLYDLTLTDSRGSRTIPSTYATLTIGSIGAPLPIIRRPSLEQSAPNPAERGGSIKWAYRIDEPSDITFHIYTVLGQEVVRLERKNQPRGPHEEIWTPLQPLSAGVYYVRFSSSSGEIWQRCIIQ